MWLTPICGTALGGSYAAAGYLIGSGREEYGYVLAVATSIALTGVIGRRFAKHGDWMPSGVVAAASAATGAYYTTKAIEVWRGLLE